MHYYKFNIKDWNDATSHMSLDEQAVYFRLLNFYYDKEAPIPNDIKYIARKLRLIGYEAQISLILAECFYLNNNAYSHAVCDANIKKYQANAKKNQINGKRGGRPSNNYAPVEEF